MNGIETKPKRQCPFKQGRYACSDGCEWFNNQEQRCLMWSFYGKVSDFITVLQDYMALQLKLQAGREPK